MIPTTLDIIKLYFSDNDLLRGKLETYNKNGDNFNEITENDINELEIVSKNTESLWGKRRLQYLRNSILVHKHKPSAIINEKDIEYHEYFPQFTELSN